MPHESYRTYRTYRNRGTSVDTPDVSNSLAALLYLLLLVPLLLIEGLLTKLFWGWFVTPVFKTAPNITLLQALGLSLLVAMLTHQSSGSKQGAVEILSSALFAPTMFFILGVTVHLLLTN